MKRIYMDYAATTPVDPRVVEVMSQYFTEKFGNPLSLHQFGQEASEVLEKSRTVVADLMGARSDEIIFTGSASESNNLALKGIALANRKRGKHIITSKIEHPCVIESSKWLEKQGFEVTRLPVDKYGIIDPNQLEQAIRKDTILVSVIHANNEIGTMEPIASMGEICDEKGVYFHTDAAQSFGKIEIDVNKMHIDLLTASSHKMYGPKGAACLYKRKGVKIDPILHGGGHEFGLRSSTHNIPAIVGFAEAAKLCKKEMKGEAERLTSLRDRLIKGMLEIEGSKLNGHPTKRLPNNANFSFAGVEGESMVMLLDSYGIAASTGSACSSAKLEPSHVLLAIGLKPQEAHGSLRLTLGRWTKPEDVDYVVEIVLQVVERLRKISPFKGWKE
jgi:cysteine desulfurase NifS